MIAISILDGLRVAAGEELDTDEKALAEAVVGDPFRDDSDGWEPPVPFDDVQTGPFPTDCLPPVLEKMVEALAESTQTPVEMSGIVALCVLSTLYQRRFTVQITQDWKETLSLYGVAVAPPGERKSAVLSTLTRPIFDYEDELRQMDAGRVAQSRTDRKILEGRLAVAEAAATKGKTPEARQVAQDEARALADELAHFHDEQETRFLVDDTTPEKLVAIMEAQGGAVTVCSAEGGIFDAMKGRYDQVGNLDVFLKGHAGDPIVVDRMGRRSNRVKSPRLTMLLMIQPEVLTGLMSDPSFRGRGLCGRFLYAVCSSNVGHRKITTEPVPVDVREGYDRFIKAALSSDYGGVIRLSPEADRARIDFAAFVEGLLGEQWEHMRDWGGKLVGAAVRIAGLFHCARSAGDPTRTLIDAETMQDAVRVACCLAKHAEKVYSMMGADPDVADAKYILKRMKSTGGRAFTKTELTLLCKGRFKKISDMNAGLAVLEERNYIRSFKEPTENSRPKTMYELNPLISI